METTQVRSIRIQYFALLREQSGRGSETVDSSALTARELYRELRAKYNFSLSEDRLAVAINDEFASWDATLKPDDTVVFIPPVAGG